MTNFLKTKHPELIQGDVQLFKVEALPEGAELVLMNNKPTNVVQASETHGKYHRFNSDAKVEVYSTFASAIAGTKTITQDQGKYLVVHEEAKLFHGMGYDDVPSAKGTGDHNSGMVMPGIYQIRITREMDFNKGEPVLVVD